MGRRAVGPVRRAHDVVGFQIFVDLGGCRSSTEAGMRGGSSAIVGRWRGRCGLGPCTRQALRGIGCSERCVFVGVMPCGAPKSPPAPRRNGTGLVAHGPGTRRGGRCGAPASMQGLDPSSRDFRSRLARGWCVRDGLGPRRFVIFTMCANAYRALAATHQHRCRRESGRPGPGSGAQLAGGEKQRSRRRASERLLSSPQSDASGCLAHSVAPHSGRPQLVDTRRRAGRLRELLHDLHGAHAHSAPPHCQARQDLAGLLGELPIVTPRSPPQSRRWGECVRGGRRGRAEQRPLIPICIRAPLGCRPGCQLVRWHAPRHLRYMRRGTRRRPSIASRYAHRIGEPPRLAHAGRDPSS